MVEAGEIVETGREPVSFDKGGSGVMIDRAITDARCAQGLPQEFGGSKRQVGGAGGVAQPFVEPQQCLATASCQHLACRLDNGAEHAGNVTALVADRRVRKSEPGLLVVT